MFAGLNKFIGSLSNVRAPPLLTMNTVFEEAQYKVFAIAVMDESEGNEARYYYTRTGDDFSSDKEFLRYIDEIRARSMWDFEKAVDVQADDDILILSTCTAESAVHFDDGRLAVFARKVRPGESADVAVNKIKANDDVIMPLAWYVNQKKEPHPYYTENGYTIPSTAEPRVPPPSPRRRRRRPSRAPTGFGRPHHGLHQVGADKAGAHNDPQAHAARNHHPAFADAADGSARAARHPAPGHRSA